ncbi:MAG: isochorismatase family protein [Rhizobacter sp.]|nr:isochorismatase family protein [Rhizobacter sp.]
MSARPLTPDADLPTALADKLAPSGCALLVIDMQNDFCAPGGYIDKAMGKDVSAAAAVVAPLQGLLDAARAAKVPVVWVHADYSHDRLPDSMRVKLKARGITAECCKPGTWGADWFGVAPLPGETLVAKRTYSGFAGTTLEHLLADAGVRTLVFAGVQTQVCVESTVRDAHSLGYLCVVPQDAVASHTPALHEATLQNVRFLFGDVCVAAEVTAAWAFGSPNTVV